MSTTHKLVNTGLTICRARLLYCGVSTILGRDIRRFDGEGQKQVSVARQTPAKLFFGHGQGFVASIGNRQSGSRHKRL